MLHSITADGVTLLICVDTRPSRPSPSLPTNLFIHNILLILLTHILLNCSFGPLNLVITILPSKESNNQLPKYFNGSILCLFLYGCTAHWNLTTFSVPNLYTAGTTPWTGDQPVIRPLPTHRKTQTQNKSTDIHASSGIRTHDPSVRAGEDGLCLRSRGHCDRRNGSIMQYISC
jgi:hypothetical protein